MSFSEHRYIFLCGVHRSGKTLLGSCLAEHPEISRLFNPDHEGKQGYDEGQFLQSVYLPGLAFDDPGAFGHQPEV